MATTMSSATMATPTRAVVLRRSRRNASASGDSDVVAGAGQATPATLESSTSRTLPPLMGVAIRPSGVPDPRIQERVSQVHEEVDDDEGEGGDQREALHLLVVAGDDGVDAEGAEARHGEERLHHDGAADEEADLQAHHGHGRD